MDIFISDLELNMLQKSDQGVLTTYNLIKLYPQGYMLASGVIKNPDMAICISIMKVNKYITGEKTGLDICHPYVTCPERLLVSMSVENAYGVECGAYLSTCINYVTDIHNELKFISEVQIQLNEILMKLKEEE